MYQFGIHTDYINSKDISIADFHLAFIIRRYEFYKSVAKTIVKIVTKFWDKNPLRLRLMGISLRLVPVVVKSTRNATFVLKMTDDYCYATVVKFAL